MKTLSFIAAALVLSAGVAVAAASAPAATTRSCTQVPFTPNSDDLAGNIRATGLTCGLARDFIRDSQGRPGDRFRGFRCTSKKVDTGALPYTSYRCTGAGDVIRWRRY